MMPEEACTTYRTELDLFALAELEPGRMVSVRDHVGQCEDCQEEISFWRSVERAAVGHVWELQQELAPEEEALAALLSEIAGLPEGDGSHPAREPHATAPIARVLRRRGVALALAATILVASALTITWGVLQTSREPGVVLLDGREVVVQDYQALQVFDGTELANLQERVRVRLDSLEVRLGPHARLRIGDSSPPRRVLSPAEGEVTLREEEGTTLVRIGDLELTLEPGEEVSLQVEEPGDGGSGTRVIIRVREGRVELRSFLGETQQPLIEIAAGE